MSKSSLEAAAEAAARVNAMLIAKGKLKLSPTQLKPKIGTTINIVGRGSGDLVTAEVEINDAPVSARNLLTRGHTQDEICKYSGAAISTRGQYMTYEEKQKSSARPLYLHIQASSQEAVDSAVSRIHEIISQHLKSMGIAKSSSRLLSVTYPPISNGAVSAPLVNISTPLSSGPLFVQDKVFIGLENAPPMYPVREKVLGPGGIYLQHIRTETGANVTLRGKGSGYIEPTSGREAFEPLYIHLTHPKMDGLQAAKTLALNLIETIHTEFIQWQQQQQQVTVQPLTPAALQAATPIGYQEMTLPVAATIPNIIQTSISLPVYTGASSVTHVPQMLNTSTVAGIIASQAQGTVAYPATYLTSPLPATPVSSTSGLLSSPVYTSTATSDSIVNHSTVPVVVSQQVPVLSQATLYTQLPQTPQSILDSVTPISYHYPTDTVRENPTTIYSVTSLPTSTVTVPVSPATSTIRYPHLQYTKMELPMQKRKFQEEPDLNEQHSDEKLVVSTRLQESSLMQPIDVMKTMPNKETSNDRKLMPPPPLLPVGKDSSVSKGRRCGELMEPEKKRRCGTLGGLVNLP